MPRKKKAKMKTKMKTKMKVRKKKGSKKTAVKRKKKILAVPKGYNHITPYLIVNEADKAIDFYKNVFKAKLVMRMEKQDGKVGHAELKIGDTKIMLADEHPERGIHSPSSHGDTGVGIHLYTKQVDNTVDKALAKGATLKMPVQDMFYGDRCGTIVDPFGHLWHVATHIEDVTPAKIRKRMVAIAESGEF